MKMQDKTLWIVLGSVGGVAIAAGIVCAVRSSKQYKAMRAVRRTNAVLRRVGHVLSSVAEATEECI